MPKKAVAKNPVVLFLHGYNSSKNDRFGFSEDLAETLSENGIASLRIDFRGCGESSGTLAEMTIPSQIEDALASLNFLSNKHSRFGIIGRSLGSGIAIKSAVQFPVDALVLISPIFDGRQWKEVPEFQAMSHFSVEEDLKKLQAVPILQMHAEKDEILSIEHLNSYRRVNTPLHRIKVIPNADHTYSDAESRKILGKESSVWFINAFYDHQYHPR